MLKYENTAKIGDNLFAYDFEPMESRAPDYVIGKVVDINSERGYKAYVIDCILDVWNGKPIEGNGSRVNTRVYVPMEISHDYEGRIEVLSI